MSKVIVVGVDGSEPAAAAAQVAARLAADTGATLHVVCAYERSEDFVLEQGSDAWRISAASTAEGVAAESAVLLSGVAPGATSAAALGKPAAVLVSEAERLDAQLIVVGNKRVQGLARVLGSIAGAVAKDAPCDVYIAHTH